MRATKTALMGVCLNSSMKYIEVDYPGTKIPIMQNKLEKLCCSLELAKKLKELGVEQESVFYWTGKALFSSGHALERLNGTRKIVIQPGQLPVDGFSAFTAGELGELLPEWFNSWREEEQKDDEKWFCWEDAKRTEKIEMQQAPTEADARGKMLIYLLENKLITLDKGD